jgi:hypothetical protein
VSRAKKLAGGPTLQRIPEEAPSTGQIILVASALAESNLGTHVEVAETAKNQSRELQKETHSIEWKRSTAALQVANDDDSDTSVGKVR